MENTRIKQKKKKASSSIYRLRIVEETPQKEKGSNMAKISSDETNRNNNNLTTIESASKWKGEQDTKEIHSGWLWKTETDLLLLGDIGQFFQGIEKYERS